MEKGKRGLRDNKPRNGRKRRPSGDAVEGRLDETRTWVLKEGLKSLRRRETPRPPERPEA